MIKEITSTKNRIFKLCCQLQSKKYRDKEDKYIIEGENLLEEAVKNNKKIYAIMLREDVVLRDDFDIDSDTSVYSMPRKLFDMISQTETSQGIIAIVNKPHYDIESLKTIISDKDCIVVLDRLQDPGNIGTIIRTADAAGYKCVVALKGTADIFSPKVIRAATGSVFRVPIILAENCRELVKLVSELHLKIVATSLKAKDFYHNVNLTEGIALVIGNEGNGISDELVDIADIKIKIPMEGNIESLNASVAAGILMYERLRCFSTKKNREVR